MRVFAKSPLHPSMLGQDGKPIVIEVPSSRGDKKYRVDLTYGRCSCPAWVYQKGGGRKPCKHLKALGYVEYNDSPVEVPEYVAPVMKDLELPVIEVDYEM